MNNMNVVHEIITRAEKLDSLANEISCTHAVSNKAIGNDPEILAEIINTQGFNFLADDSTLEISTTLEYTLGILLAMANETLHLKERIDELSRLYDTPEQRAKKQTIANSYDNYLASLDINLYI